jgi:hypothetical protein
MASGSAHFGTARSIRRSRVETALNRQGGRRSEEKSSDLPPGPPPSCTDPGESGRAEAQRLNSTRPETAQERYRASCGTRAQHRRRRPISLRTSLQNPCRAAARRVQAACIGRAASRNRRTYRRLAAPSSTSSPVTVGDWTGRRADRDLERNAPPGAICPGDARPNHMAPHSPTGFAHQMRSEGTEFQPRPPGRQ